MSPGLRIAFSVVGVLTCLTGGVFFLQGIGLIGGSFMSHTLDLDRDRRRDGRGRRDPPQPAPAGSPGGTGSGPAR